MSFFGGNYHWSDERSKDGESKKNAVVLLRWVLVAGGFAGTLVIIRPGGANFSWAMVLPLLLEWLGSIG